MAARRKTKAQKLASLRAKERAAKRTKPITPLDFWAIKIYEGAEALKRAGLDEETVMGWIVDQPLPDWFIENPERFDEDDDDDYED